MEPVERLPQSAKPGGWPFSRTSVRRFARPIASGPVAAGSSSLNPLQTVQTVSIHSSCASDNPVIACPTKAMHVRSRNTVCEAWFLWIVVNRGSLECKYICYVIT